ncbi:hypothetical protein WJX74_000865 [Apatococcus lobatus]|uniref:Uncharacterized protein n=1 Tax=Apatococcus lobatus TaxID=904363 RepID=A0AAW1QXQ5_9CHLO
MSSAISLEAYADIYDQLTGASGLARAVPAKEHPCYKFQELKQVLQLHGLQCGGRGTKQHVDLRAELQAADLVTLGWADPSVDLQASIIEATNIFPCVPAFYNSQEAPEKADTNLLPESDGKPCKQPDHANNHLPEQRLEPHSQPDFQPDATQEDPMGRTAMLPALKTKGHAPDLKQCGFAGENSMPLLADATGQDSSVFPPGDEATTSSLKQVDKQVQQGISQLQLQHETVVQDRAQLITSHATSLQGRRVAFILPEACQMMDAANYLDLLHAGLQTGQVREALPGCSAAHDYAAVRIKPNSTCPPEGAPALPRAEAQARRVDLTRDLHVRHRCSHLRQFLEKSNLQLQDAWCLLEPVASSPISIPAHLGTLGPQDCPPSDPKSPLPCSRQPSISLSPPIFMPPSALSTARAGISLQDVVWAQLGGAHWPATVLYIDTTQAQIRLLGVEVIKELPMLMLSPYSQDAAKRKANLVSAAGIRAVSDAEAMLALTA